MCNSAVQKNPAMEMTSLRLSQRQDLVERIDAEGIMDYLCYHGVLDPSVLSGLDGKQRNSAILKQVEKHGNLALKLLINALRQSWQLNLASSLDTDHRIRPGTGYFGTGRHKGELTVRIQIETLNILDRVESQATITSLFTLQTPWAINRSDDADGVSIGDEGDENLVTSCWCFCLFRKKKFKKQNKLKSYKIDEAFHLSSVNKNSLTLTGVTKNNSRKNKLMGTSKELRDIPEANNNATKRSTASKTKLKTLSKHSSPDGTDGSGNRQQEEMRSPSQINVMLSNNETTGRGVLADSDNHQASILSESFQHHPHILEHQPGTKLHSGSQVYQPGTKLYNGSKVYQPGTKLHSGSKVYQPGTKLHSGSKFYQPGTKLHSGSQVYQPGTKLHSGSQVYQPGTKLYSDSQVYQPGTKLYSGSQVYQPGTKLHSGSKVFTHSQQPHQQIPDSNYSEYNSKLELVRVRDNMTQTRDTDKNDVIGEQSKSDGWHFQQKASQLSQQISQECRNEIINYFEQELGILVLDIAPSECQIQVVTICMLQSDVKSLQQETHGGSLLRKMEDMFSKVALATLDIQGFKLKLVLDDLEAATALYELS